MKRVFTAIATTSDAMNNFYSKFGQRCFILTKRPHYQTAPSHMLIRLAPQARRNILCAKSAIKIYNMDKELPES